MECGFIFCFKNEAGCKKLHPKKNVECGVISKNTLKDMETIRFRSSEWWHIYNWNCRSNDIFGPRPHIQFNHQPMETLVGVSHCCRNLLQSSAFCWLIPSGLPLSLSPKEVQHCHFNAALWPALTSNFRELKAGQRLSKTFEHIQC